MFRWNRNISRTEMAHRLAMAFFHGFVRAVAFRLHIDHSSYNSDN
jgi:hypothetical protein